MELTPEQIAAIVGTTLGVGLAAATCYITGKAEGIRLGLQRGHRDGYGAALDQLEPELHETTRRLNSAERILAAAQAELGHVQDQRTRERRQAAEALEEATLRLDAAQGLNAGHSALLRQASTNLELAAATWDAMTATRKARDARAVAGQLRELAAALGAERQEVAA